MSLQSDVATDGFLCITSETGVSSGNLRSTARRTSPSVRVPTSTPSSSTIRTIRNASRSIASIAYCNVAVGETTASFQFFITSSQCFAIYSGAEKLHSCGDVPANRNSRANDAVFAQRDALNDVRACTDVNAVMDGHPAAYRHAWRYMAMPADHAIVIDGRSGVYDRVLTDHRVGLDDRASHDLRAARQCRVRADCGKGMNDRRKRIACAGKPFIKTATHVRDSAWQRSDPDRQPYGIGRKSEDGVVVAPHFHAPPGGHPTASQFRRHDALYICSRSAQCLEQNLCMPTRTEHNHRNGVHSASPGFKSLVADSFKASQNSIAGRPFPARAVAMFSAE